MKNLRKILLPFSLIYGIIVGIRNWAFDKGFLKSASFKTPIVIVGNLNMGGTGKTPQIEYLISLLNEDFNVGIISRGYKRMSKGFQMAHENSTFEQIGDEPFQFYKKFPGSTVAVDANRTRAIQILENKKNPPDVILLDDAFQHRKVKGGLNILLTTYKDLYANDFVLPAGNLREGRKGARRANIIVITKCPINLTEERMKAVANSLKIENNQSIYFSHIKYDNFVRNEVNRIEVDKLKDYKVVLVTGIANFQPLLQFLATKDVSYRHMKYPDHHNFSASDKRKINGVLESVKSKDKIILTTEKDYVRGFSVDNNSTYYLPIESKLIQNEEKFNKQVLNYVRANSRNSKLS